MLNTESNRNGSDAHIVDDNQNTPSLISGDEELNGTQISILSVNDEDDDDDENDRVTILSLSEFDFEGTTDADYNTTVNQIGFGNEQDSHLNIISIYQREYPRLGASGLRLYMKFRQPPPGTRDLELWLTECVTELLECIRSALNIQVHDRVGMSFNNNSCVKSSFHISFRRFDQYSADFIFSQLNSVLQSNERFLISDNLNINVDHIQMPIGYGRTYRMAGTSFTQFVEDHPKTIFNPHLDPQHKSMCLAVAIVLGEAFADGVISQNRFNFLTYKQNYNELIAEAYLLCHYADVDLSNGGGLDEIKKFQDYLHPAYDITVYDCARGRSTLFRNGNTNAVKKIRLLLENNHYTLIKSTTGAFGFSYYCEPCNRGFSDPLKHRACPYKCPCCYSKPPCPKRNQNIMCADCNRGFRSEFCFNKHQSSNLCSKVKICGQCYSGYKVNNRKPHVCNTKYCSICRKDQPIRHECFIPTLKPRALQNTKELFIFYDFECVQDTPFPDDPTKFEHKPNLCVAQTACNICLDELSSLQDCQNCGVRSHTFKTDDVVEEFMKFIAGIDKKFKQVTILAHNMQGYDGHFCLRYMYQHKNVWYLNENSLIMNGTKILKIKIDRFTFLDSLNFFMVPLAKLPKMFNLEDVKGYYPHYFNTPQNFNYVGAIPDAKFYSPDTMKPKARKEFMEWYQDQIVNNVVFDNQVELEKYCTMDVSILRQACLKFRSLLISMTEVDPFKNVTIASTCMAVFKTKFLEENTIGVAPPRGYRLTDHQSKKALKWLELMKMINNADIQTALTGREVRIAQDIVVDGFDADTNTVYEFYGCYWHQCRNCFPIQAHKDVSNKNLKYSLRYDATIARSYRIKRLGYNLVEIWECEFDRILKRSPQTERNLASIPGLVEDALNPRDAFFGGRTNACKLYHKVDDDNEKIHYYDVCSLYPYINKYFKYPVGHPEILLNDKLQGVTVFNTEGLFKVLVLPPRNLYHPVLPIKMHQKLMFILCYTCAKDKLQSDCNHTESERGFIGTYVADELRVACNEGYTVLKIFECWKYNVEQYDSVSKTGGIFTEYINTFLKIKTEASGYPLWCVTDDDKDKFISDFHAREGIRLDKLNIQKNPGLRSLSKLMLNSLWGKLGQRDDKIQKAIVNTQHELLNIVTNPAYEAESFHELTVDSLLVAYKLRAESLVSQANVSVVSAAYTTANARLELYKYLKFLGERVLYFDTDSVIFTSKTGEQNPLTGDYLGDLTDEISEYGCDAYISEFVSGGPKNYAYKVEIPDESPKFVCKVKGINLNYENSERINFATIKNCVFNSTDPIELENRIILRTKENFIYSTMQKYKYNINVTKRRRIGMNGLSTLPFGYVNHETN